MRILGKALFAAALLAPASAAHAGVYTDDLTRCLAKAASSTDKTALVSWIFAAIGKHPAVSSYISMDEAQAQETTKHAAMVFQRLIATDCRKQSVEAIKYEGASAWEAAFKVLGEIAMVDLMQDPGVSKATEQIASFLDEKTFEDLGKEAGVRSAADSKK